jgi:tight adherence protein C
VADGALLLTGLGALGLAIMLLVAAVFSGGGQRALTVQLLESIERRYASQAPADGTETVRPLEPPLTWLRALALRLSPSGSVASLQRRLDMAGNPAGWNTDRMLAAKGLGLVALAVLGALIGFRSPALAVLALPLGAAAGLYLPDVLLYNTGVKRQERLQMALPDAMDLLTICVEAGQGFDGALAKVASSIEGPLAAEFARALREMQIGKSRTEALRALAARTTVSELRAFVSALVQAGELGVAIADVLREQAREMRLRRRQRAEEKAQKVPVKILFPLMTCLLPALFVLVIGPGVISISHSLFK